MMNYDSKIFTVSSLEAMCMTDENDPNYKPRMFFHYKKPSTSEDLYQFYKYDSTSAVAFQCKETKIVSEFITY